MNKPSKKNTLDSNIVKIIEAKHHDPFSVLGRHSHGNKTVIRHFCLMRKPCELAPTVRKCSVSPAPMFLSTSRKKNK